MTRFDGRKYSMDLLTDKELTPLDIAIVENIIKSYDPKEHKFQEDAPFIKYVNKYCNLRVYEALTRKYIDINLLETINSELRQHSCVLMPTRFSLLDKPGAIGNLLNKVLHNNEYS